MNRELILNVANRTIAMNMKRSRPSRFLGDWFESWDWGPGLAYFALCEVYRRTGEAYLFDAIKEYVDLNRARAVRYSVNSTVPAMSALTVYLETGDESYAGIVRKNAEFLMKDAGRTEDGLIVHGGVDMDFDNEVWIDTAVMAGVFLVKAGQALGCREWTEEGVRQTLGHFEKLRDASGLVYHGFSYRTMQHIGCLWARGNAWATFATALTLDKLEGMEREQQRLRELAAEQAVYLRYMQDPRCGGFYTVLNDSSSYQETSATAGIAYGLREGIRMGYLPEDFASCAERASEFVRNHINHEGEVCDVSAGTGVQTDYTWYKMVRKDVPMPWGQCLAMFLLLLD